MPTEYGKRSGYVFIPSSGAKITAVNNTSEKDISLGHLIMISGLLPIFAAITMQGTLRDGVLTWMPSFVSERFNLSGSTSILTAVLLPVFSVISFHLYLYSVKNQRLLKQLYISLVLELFRNDTFRYLISVQ